MLGKKMWDIEGFQITATISNISQITRPFSKITVLC